MIEQYGVITGVMPIGGWRFVQPLADGSTQRIPISGCAGTDSKLVEQVKAFRIQAGIDYGDPAADVAEYIKSVSVINQRFRNRPHKQSSTQISQAAGFRPYIERIKDWLRSLGGKQLRLLIEDDADERVESCFGCPHNVPWKTGCLPCCEAVTTRGQNVRQRPGYKHDKKLGACRLHNTHLSTAIFLDRENLPATHPEAPANCWMRKAT